MYVCMYVYIYIHMYTHDYMSLERFESLEICLMCLEICVSSWTRVGLLLLSLYII